MRVLIPVSCRDVDITEVAVPRRILTDAGQEVVLATERAGTRPAADPRLLTGVLFGRLGAEEEPLRFCRELTASPEFHTTVSRAQTPVEECDALLLPGGHARGGGSTPAPPHFSGRSRASGR